MLKYAACSSERVECDRDSVVSTKYSPKRFQAAIRQPNAKTIAIGPFVRLQDASLESLESLGLSRSLSANRAVDAQGEPNQQPPGAKYWEVIAARFVWVVPRHFITPNRIRRASALR